MFGSFMEPFNSAMTNQPYSTTILDTVCRHWVCWDLTALSAQMGYIVPEERLKFVEKVYF